MFERILFNLLCELYDKQTVLLISGGATEMKFKVLSCVCLLTDSIREYHFQTLVTMGTYILRKANDRWGEKVLKCRSSGKPPTWWTDDLMAARVPWMRAAQDLSV